MKVCWSPTTEAAVVDVKIVLLYDKRGRGVRSSTIAAAKPPLGTRLCSFGVASWGRR
jgi:hypothetical protein